MNKGKNKPKRKPVVLHDIPGEQEINCEIFDQHLEVFNAGEIKDRLLYAKLRGHSLGCSICKSKVT